MLLRLLVVIGSWILRLRYRVRVTGGADIAARGARGILFLPNHPGLIDPIIVMCELHGRFRPRSLGDKARLASPLVAWVSKRFGAIVMPDPTGAGGARKAEVDRALDACKSVLQSGQNLLLYPAGHLQRARLEDVGGNSAVEVLLERVPEARVVLVRTRGLWGSSFSWGSGSAPEMGKAFLHGALRLLASFIFFAPKRPVSIELTEPADFPRAGRAAINRHLEAFYNEDAPPARYVPYSPWERGTVRDLPEPPSTRPSGDPDAVSPAIRDQVIARIREMTGTERLTAELELARDLGMDSLSRMDLLLFVEQEFGHPCSDPDALLTVGDVVLAAAGQALQGSAAIAPPPARWFTSRALAPIVPEGDTIPAVFLRQAARDPSRVFLADAKGGARSFRDAITAVYALRPHLARLEGDHLGIMLPASGGAAVLYLAALFAGKIPVMVNWTIGARSVTHGLELLGVRHVVTAQALLAKLSEQGTDLGAAAERMLPIEELGKRIRLYDKLRAFVLARASWAPLRRARVAGTAVVLFTSGSESLPKAVPLTHANILTNLRDTLSIVDLRAGDKAIGFLPPFHSFGLTCTVVLALAAGIPVVYHPNPTEGLAIARIVHAYRTTLLIGTPTFLAGAVRAATDDDLACLRFVISGAEKCPDSLHDTIAQRWSTMTVLEGYGITECSPIVSANRENAVRRGSIGWPLPSIDHAIIDLERGERVAPGQIGMLLVRGPSVFSGYIGYDGPSPFEQLEGKRWYRTGDLVREEPDGRLMFSGRLKRFVKLGGEMISLPAIEEALVDRLGRSDDGTIDIAVEATPSEQSPEIVLFAARPVTREQANLAIRAAGLSALHNVRTVRPVETIPLLGTGKTDYRALKAMLTAV